jgi:ribosome biogenesis protein ERB1
MSSKKRTQAVATAITVAKPTGKAAAKQAVQASSKAATRPTQKSTQKSTAPVFEVHSQLGDDDDEDGAVESDAESQDDEFDEAMQRAAEDSDEGVSSRSSTRPVSAHDGSSSDDVDSEDADDSQDDVEFDTDEDDEAEFSDDDAEHDEESDEPEASEASAASKPISKKSEARTEAVRAAHTTMKRAHMGKAGRLLIRKSGDAPSGVNWAENSDSSEDEHENRIGNVPIEWYAEHDHIGYRVDGSKMTKKTQQDQLDRFLTSIDDPNAKRTVYDEINDRNVVISEEEMRIIQRMRHGKLPGKEFDAFAEFGDWFSSEKEIHPLGNVFEPKARFIPSKHEGRKIYKLVNAIRNGWIKLDEEEDLESAEAKEAKKAEALYLIWDGQAADRNRNAPPPITAPKPKLPGHAESYNPPAEYLPTEEELSAWENMDPEDRPLNFVPQQYDAMRKIPLYPDMLKERFERCLDLYLCPRARRKRLNIDPDSLLPQLPKPAELKPFPTSVAIEYKGHSAAVRTLSVSPTGQWLASGAADGEVQFLF